MTASLGTVPRKDLAKKRYFVAELDEKETQVVGDVMV
jgi:hypothetical protein